MKKCPFCAEEVQDEAIICKYCKNNLPKTLPNKTQPSSLSVFLNQHKTAVIIVVFAVLALGLIIGHSSPGSSLQSAQPNAPAVTQSGSPTPSPAATVSYEVVKSWTFPDNGQGELIVIPPSDLNDTDMTNLGLTLKNDLQSYTNAIVFVYTSKQAAALRDKVIDNTATPAETALYDSSDVAGYNKNSATGYHAFNIMFAGVDGNNDKEIDY